MSTARKVRQRHAQYYHSVLKPLNERYLLSRDDENLITEYDLEQGQIEHALDWVRNLQSDASLVSLLRGYLDDGDPLLSRSWLIDHTIALEQRYKVAERYEEIQVLLGHLGQCYARLGAFDAALEKYEAKIAFARQRGDRFSEIETYHDLAFIHVLRKDLSEASKLQQQVIAKVSEDKLPHIFLSYNRKNAKTMNLIRERLTLAGFDCWVDESDMSPGVKNFPSAVEKAISSSGGMIVVMSPQAKNSEWVQLEISAALTHGITIFPVMSAGNKKNAIPFLLGTTNWAADLRGKGTIETELEKLCSAIHRHLANRI